VAWSVAELWRSRITAPRIGSPIDSLGQSGRPRGEQGRPEQLVRRGFARRGFPYGCSPLGQRARKRSSRSASITSINESGPPRSRAARRRPRLYRWCRFRSSQVSLRAGVRNSGLRELRLAARIVASPSRSYPVCLEACPASRCRGRRSSSRSGSNLTARPNETGTGSPSAASD